MKRLMVPVLVVAALLAAGAAAYAEMGGCGCGHEYNDHRGGRMGGGIMTGQAHEFMKHIDHLTLDANQKAAVKEVRTRTQKEMIKKRSDMQVSMVELRELLDTDTVDMKAVEAKLRQVETQRTAVHLAMIKAREEIRSRLTAEQKKQLREMLDKGMGCMQHDGDDDTLCPGPGKCGDGPHGRGPGHMKHK